MVRDFLASSAAALFPISPRVPKATALEASDFRDLSNKNQRDIIAM